MYEGLLIILGPMFVGYLIKTQNITFLRLINQLITFFLYVILLVMGIALGQMDDLATKLPTIALSAFTFSIIIQSVNIIGLLAYDKLRPHPLKHSGKQIPSRWKLILDSLKLCATVLAGFILGLLSKTLIQLPMATSTYILVAMIFCVGVQLRNNGIGLREVFFNKPGIYAAVIFIVTSLLGGVISAYFLDLPAIQGLAVASGFGWYSLSSVILNDAWGPIFGSIAFFNDLSREILSFFVIPLFMRNYRTTAVGITGATALDCTLPIIQRAGGMEVIPLAISFGFIINIAAPILLVFFSSIPL